MTHVNRRWQLYVDKYAYEFENIIIYVRINWVVRLLSFIIESDKTELAFAFNYIIISCDYMDVFITVAIIMAVT